MKLESEKAEVILGFIGVSWVSRGTLVYKALRIRLAYDKPDTIPENDVPDVIVLNVYYT